MNPLFLVAGALLVAFPRVLCWLAGLWLLRLMWNWANS